MKKITTLFFLAIGLSGTFASADPCFWSQSIRDWKYENRTTVLLDAGKTDYRLSVDSCWRLRFADNIAFETWPSGSSRVCRGDNLLVMDGFSRRVIEKCGIRKIEKIKN